MDEEESCAIICDNGSHMIKAGFNTDNSPKCVFPNIIGVPKLSTFPNGIRRQISYVGNKTKSTKDVLSLKYPIEDDIIQSWDDMEEVWNYTFYNELKIEPEEYPILLTEPNNFKYSKHRENITEIMFETFNTPAMYLCLQSILSLYASGNTTGLVLDFGNSLSHIVPIYEGYALKHAMNDLDAAGKQITLFLKKLLNENGCSFSNSTSDLEIVNDIKHKFCYVALNYDIEYNKSQNKDKVLRYYKLPDGKIIKINKSRFLSPEILFNPPLINNLSFGIHKLSYNSIMKCNIDIRKDLYKNIILSGGTTMFPDLDGRLYLEMKMLAPFSYNINIISPPERKYSVFIGGCILTQLNSFSDWWVTKYEYDEIGPAIVHRKCF